MTKQLFLFKQILILFLMSFIFIGCEQIEFTNLFKGISKEDIDNAVLRMKKISLKYSKPVWDVDTDTEQYMEFSFDTIEGTEKVKAIYYESNKRLVVARKDSKLKNVVQLYYIKNISLDSEYINFNNNTFCEDFIMVN